MDDVEFEDVEYKLNAYIDYRNDADITDWERKFMDDQVARFEQYGQRTRFSEKQMDIIKRVFDKLPL